MAAIRRNKVTEAIWAMHRGLYRDTGGRIGGKLGGFRVLALTTAGRKSKEPRTVLLFTIEHPDGWLVVGSHAGEPRHPPWWLNLVAEPNATVKIKGAEHGVRARELEGTERSEAMKRFEEIDSAYRTYQERTDRRLPVVLLERMAS